MLKALLSVALSISLLTFSENCASAQEQAQPELQQKVEETQSIEAVQLVLNLKQRQLYVFKNKRLVARYPVAIGKKGWQTPIGTWRVREKLEHPAWTNFLTGRVVPPGANNPLGSRWIEFWSDGRDRIGFHATKDLKSIGQAASHGCVRMFTKDVEALYTLVKVGTLVVVIAGSN